MYDFKTCGRNANEDDDRFPDSRRTNAENERFGSHSELKRTRRYCRYLEIRTLVILQTHIYPSQHSRS